MSTGDASSSDPHSRKSSKIKSSDGPLLTFTSSSGSSSRRIDSRRTIEEPHIGRYRVSFGIIFNVVFTVAHLHGLF